MQKKIDDDNLTIQSYANIDDLYENIPKEGSLGLLALGHVGLMLWRKKRVELLNQQDRTNEKK